MGSVADRYEAEDELRQLLLRMEEYGGLLPLYMASGFLIAAVPDHLVEQLRIKMRSLMEYMDLTE